MTWCSMEIIGRRGRCGVKPVRAPLAFLKNTNQLWRDLFWTLIRLNYPIHAERRRLGCTDGFHAKELYGDHDYFWAPFLWLQFTVE